MIFKNNNNAMKTEYVPLPDGGSFPVLCFADWQNLKGVRHCFSTRAGGVSEGWLASLNFRRELYDPDENILENFTRIGRFFGVKPERIVCAQQTHTANVRIITEGDAGKGVTRPRDYTDVDGIITNVPGLVLYTSHADCVPLYFYDPVKKVIALSHSGWKGTVSRIGAVTIRKMHEHYGCDPKDIYAAVGPSICSDCYEVSEDVADEFCGCFSAKWKADFPEAEKKSGGETAARAEISCGCEKTGSDADFLPANGEGVFEKESGGETAAQAEISCGCEKRGSGEESSSDNSRSGKSNLHAKTTGFVPDQEIIPMILRTGRKPGKFQLDLWQANVRILREAGIKSDHITVTNVCTCENSSELFSHRATAGKRGNQGAFLMLEDM